MPLDFIGERDDRVQADHLDRAGRLVDVRARMLERRHVLRLRRERGERLQPSRERLVDLRLDPGQRPQIEIECRFGSHGRSFLTHGSRPSQSQEAHHTIVRPSEKGTEAGKLLARRSLFRCRFPRPPPGRPKAAA